MADRWTGRDRAYLPSAALRPDDGKYIVAQGAIIGGIAQILVGIGTFIELKRLIRFENFLVEEANELNSSDSSLAA